MVKILCGIDGSKHSMKAARFAKWVAERFAAQVTLIFVGQIPVMNLLTYYPSMISPEILPDQVEARIEEHGGKALDEAAEVFAGTEIKVEKIVRFGHPAATICDEARDGKYDLVMVGHRGLSGLEEMVLGSVSDRVVHGAPCPVLVVK